MTSATTAAPPGAPGPASTRPRTSPRCASCSVPASPALPGCWRLWTSWSRSKASRRASSVSTWPTSSSIRIRSRDCWLPIPTAYEFGFLEWQPAGGWTLLSSDFLKIYYEYLAQDPGDPRRVFSLSSYGGVHFSGDRGHSWEFRGGTSANGGEACLRSGPRCGSIRAIPTIWLPAATFPFPKASTAGGAGRSRTISGTARLWPSILPAIFSTPVSTRCRCAVPPTKGAPASDDNFCARQERFELTVEWKTPNGATGVARKVETGSQESGLFYFFDPNNWELLVKVLDGCGLNQRFWVFTAGTTDVEYLLKVEDRWTGKVRTYFNRAARPPRRPPTPTPSPPAPSRRRKARRRRPSSPARRWISRRPRRPRR